MNSLIFYESHTNGACPSSLPHALGKIDVQVNALEDTRTTLPFTIAIANQWRSDRHAPARDMTQRLARRRLERLVRLQQRQYH